LNLIAQNKVYICLNNNYHEIEINLPENILPSVESKTIHMGLNMRYHIEDIDSIVFIKPKNLAGHQVGWKSLTPQKHFQYKLPPMQTNTTYYDIQLSDSPTSPQYAVNLLMNFNNFDSYQTFVSQYTKRTKNWKQTMRTLTRGRRIPTRHHYVTPNREGVANESIDSLAIIYSDLFADKSIDDIHKALFYWQNFPPDVELPLSSADSIALPLFPIFGQIDNLENIKYQLELPQKGLTCIIVPFYDGTQYITGYQMTLTYNQAEEAQEAYQAVVEQSDTYYFGQLEGSTLIITNYFTDTDSRGNTFPISIQYDYFIQRLVVLDLEWNRPLVYELMNQ
jgi:hypothetical protein